MKVESRKIADIVLRDDLYPRIEKDAALVQRYCQVVHLLPPIEINQHNELIDGWHRWTAHKKEKAETIKVTVTKTTSDVELLALAYRRNAAAGKQLAESDKRKGAIRLYNGGEGLEKAEIAKILSVVEHTVSRYLQDIDKQLKLEREEKMLAMWLACYDQQAIADEVGLHVDTVSEFLQKIRNLDNCPKSEKSAILHESNFDHRQLYSIWNFPKATNQVRHFGNIPPEIIDNILYYYTQPFDVVFDPFGGGGSTIDKCKERYRRYYVSDLTPIEERSHEIWEHDITTGIPKDLPLPNLVFLDPPYWKQAQKKYSNKNTDLGNVTLEKFISSVGSIAQQFKRRWQAAKKPGVLSLIIGPAKENKKYVDLAYLCHQQIGKYLSPHQRIIVPYSTQVHGGAFVKKAKEAKEILYLYRDLMVFKYEPVQKQTRKRKQSR